MKSVKLGVFVLVMVALGVAIAGCGSSKTHGEEGTLVLTQPGGNSGTFTPIGKFNGKSFSPGTGAAISNPYQNAAKKTVGELNAICLDTQKASGEEGLSGTCTATVTVPGGTFALNVGGKGILTGAGVSGAITGGTGKYNGALGNFSSKPTGENGPSTVTFNYILP